MRSSVLRDMHAEFASRAPDVFVRLIPLLQPTDDSTRIGIFPSRQLVVIEGGWWYRGEYRVIPASGGGTVLTYSIVNVAQRSHVLGRLAAARALSAAPASFARLVRGLRIDVGG